MLVAIPPTFFVSAETVCHPLEETVVQMVRGWRLKGWLAVLFERRDDWNGGCFPSTRGRLVLPL